MKNDLAGRLSSLRVEKKISQKEAAQALGVSQAVLSHYEKGIRECKLPFVIKAAGYYGVSTDYLLGVSRARQGGGSLMSVGDRAEDAVFASDTMLRAFLSSREISSALDDGGAAEELFDRYLSASLAGFYSELAQRGEVKRESLPVPPDKLGSAARLVIDSVSHCRPETKMYFPDSGELPVAVLTVIDRCLDEAQRVVADLRPDFNT